MDDFGVEGYGGKADPGGGEEGRRGWIYYYLQTFNPETFKNLQGVHFFKIIYTGSTKGDSWTPQDIWT